MFSGLTKETLERITSEIINNYRNEIIVLEQVALKCFYGLPFEAKIFSSVEDARKYAEQKRKERGKRQTNYKYNQLFSYNVYDKGELVDKDKNFMP